MIQPNDDNSSWVTNKNFKYNHRNVRECFWADIFSSLTHAASTNLVCVGKVNPADSGAD